MTEVGEGSVYRDGCSAQNIDGVTYLTCNRFEDVASKGACLARKPRRSQVAEKSLHLRRGVTGRGFWNCKSFRMQSSAGPVFLSMATYRARISRIFSASRLRSVPAILAVSIVAPALPAYADSHASFDDPARTGKMAVYDGPAVPKIYQGMWADSAANCHAVSDRGRQVRISADAVGTDRIQRIETQSDRPSIILAIASDEGDNRRLIVELSSDENHIFIRQLDGRGADRFVRCPLPHAAPPRFLLDDWLERNEQISFW